MKKDTSDNLSVQEILSYLPKKLPQELFNILSGRILIYDSLESTNITAKDMALSGSEHGTVIIANSQTAGKGRHGKSFYSPPDFGLYISFILDLEKSDFKIPTLITAFAAVSVCEAIEAISEKTPLIKWVNDIFLDGKKICGILTESVTSVDNPAIQRVILGIGVNFSTPAEKFPKELQQAAGSLFKAEKPHTTRNHLAAEIISRIIFPKSQTEQKMLEKYRQRMLLLGKPVLVTGAEESYEAIAVEIDDTGRLIVKKSNGELIPLSSGEVSIKNQ